MISMKIPSRLGAWCALVLCLHQVAAAPVPSDQSGPQLTVELRDGSRVVARSLDDTVNFHSLAMGDLKLTWAGIRSIEYAAATNTARLTMTNGDAFTVQIVADALRLETGFGQTVLPVKLIRGVKVAPPARLNAVAGANPARLMIELRDGSRVACKGLDDTLNFHSPAMGDMKLTWADIRSIRYATSNTEMARLTATNGDVYEVQFAATAVTVETSFGKTELPVKLIRSITVSAAGVSGQLPSGLVALWSGEGNANDSAGENNGTLHGGVTFAKGQVGQAFSFDGSTGFVSVPHTSLWDFGNNPFTIAFWANFNSSRRQEDFITDDNGYGLSQNKWAFWRGMQGNTLTFDVAGPRLENIGKFPFSPVPGQWYHIAMTREGSDWTFYTNGVMLGTTSVSITVPSMNEPLTIGNCGEGTAYFDGLLDEVSIYNRALSAEEIQAVCREQNNGELPTPPTNPSRPMSNDSMPRAIPGGNFRSPGY